VVPVYVLCRRGIDSVRAAQVIECFMQARFVCGSNDSNPCHAVQLLQDHGHIGNVFNIAGGLQAWAKKVDPTFPTY